jgi:seryl-tRNA synthetase
MVHVGIDHDFELFSTLDRWLEISSVSNFETFKPNRLKYVLKTKMEKPTSAYLKRSSLVCQVLAGILEKLPDGRRNRIKVLRPYCGFDIID